jgi:hypothetical protein
MQIKKLTLRGYLNIGDSRFDISGGVHFKAKLALEYCVDQVTQRLRWPRWIKELPLVVSLSFQKPIADKL